MAEGHDYAVRALELHSLYAWDYDWIIKCLDFMVRQEYNTLVLHRNDFIDLIAYPGKYFGCTGSQYETIFDRYKEIFRTLYKFTPTRRSSPYQRRAFFKRVLEQAKRRGIAVYIENKELFFPDVMLEFFPNLVKDGKVCANDPFWIEFLKVKYQEFFEEFPEVAGVITAVATGESKISITSNRCTCDLCKSTSKAQWFKSVLEAMHSVTERFGKRLVVRDFVFNPAAHHAIASVMEELPPNVAMSLKNTPHDYYPTFPTNTRIGGVGDHEQWIEFDAMGQYFGWGIGMADLLEDYRERLAYAKDRGATGFIVRTDWESLDGHTVFRTPNLVNLYSIAKLATTLDTPAAAIYDEYLAREQWYDPQATDEQRRQALGWFSTIMSTTWSITRHIPFIDSCVFSDSSLCPVSYEHAFWLAEEKNSLKDWDASKQDVLSPIGGRVEFALREKDSAVAEARQLEQWAGAGCSGLRPEKVKDLQQRLGIQSLYARLYQTVTAPIVLTRYVLTTKEARSGEYYGQKVRQLQEALDAMVPFATMLDEFHATTDYRPHTIYTLLDPDRVRCLQRDLLEKTHELFV